MLNKKISVMALFLVSMSIEGHATRLKDLNLGPVCQEDDLVTEPHMQRKVLKEARWSTLLGSPENKSIFDFETTNKMIRAGQLIRDDVDPSHIVNLIADGFKRVREAELRLINKGELKPIGDGQTYDSQELAKRRDSMGKFYAQYISPVLQDSYSFYISVVKNRLEVRGRNRANGGALTENDKKILERVNQQREILNKALQQYAPSVVEKLGLIPVAKDRNLPMSYRDGVPVILRLEKMVEGRRQSVSLFPRMLANQILDQDEFFLRGLTVWRDYTKTKMDETQETLTTGGSIMIPRHILQADLEAQQIAYEKASEDLINANKIHLLMKKMTQDELFTLMDLFRSLQNGNVPECGEVIVALNELMTKKLHGQSSTRAKTASPLSPEARDRAESFAKDVVFYQNIYNAFADVAAVAR